MLRTIRAKIILLSLLYGASMAWLGQKITFGYIQLQTHHVQMKISYTVTEASRTLLTRKVTDKEFSNLQLWRKKLTPEYREDQFSNILSAAAQGRSGRLRNLVRAFLVNETSYRQNLQNQIDFWITKSSTTDPSSH